MTCHLFWSALLASRTRSAVEITCRDWWNLNEEIGTLQKFLMPCARYSSNRSPNVELHCAQNPRTSIKSGVFLSNDPSRGMGSDSSRLSSHEHLLYRYPHRPVARWDEFVADYFLDRHLNPFMWKTTSRVQRKCHQTGDCLPARSTDCKISPRSVSHQDLFRTPETDYRNSRELLH